MAGIKDVKGLSLVELLVSTLVIAILVAVAIPQFATYRVRTHNTTAMSDLRNLQRAMETFYCDHYYYPSIP